MAVQLFDAWQRFLNEQDRKEDIEQATSQTWSTKVLIEDSLDVRNTHTALECCPCMVKSRQYCHVGYFRTKRFAPSPVFPHQLQLHSVGSSSVFPVTGKAFRTGIGFILLSSSQYETKDDSELRSISKANLNAARPNDLQLQPHNSLISDVPDVPCIFSLCIHSRTFRMHFVFNDTIQP